MTIEELLEMAQHNLAMIDGAIGGETVTRYAAIAQAAAQTAQAMILNERDTLTIERIGEYATATVGMVGRLEVRND